MTRPSRGDRESIALSRKNARLLRPIRLNLNLTDMNASPESVNCCELVSIPKGNGMASWARSAQSWAANLNSEISLARTRLKALSSDRGWKHQPYTTERL